MTTNTQLYSIAKKHLGAGGSIFRKYCGLTSNQPWCNAYVCYIFNEGGLKKLFYGGKKVTYCPTSIKWCQSHLAQIPLYLAMPMDVIYFDWERNGIPNHIGFVKKRKSTNKIYTHEGNTSGGIVDERIRDNKDIQGVFRPHYKPASLPKTYILTVNDDFDYATIYSLQHILKVKETGILDISTVKALQKLFGANADGAWGPSTSKKIQKVIGVTADGAFGPASVKAFKKWINKKVGATSTDESSKPVEEKKAYTGTMPSLIPATARKAVEFAYALNTNASRYAYVGGKPKAAYAEALKKEYPDKSGWGKRTSAGASCDVFAGVVMRASKADIIFPRGLDGQGPHLERNYKTTDKATNGDILYKKTHIAIAVSIKGKMYNANAHYGREGVKHSKYPIIEKLHSYTKIYKPNAALTPLIKDDKFTDVIYLQKFLNWYGNYKLKEDYIFGKLTEDAVKDFQKKEGLVVDGMFGEKSLAKAKTIKK